MQRVILDTNIYGEMVLDQGLFAFKDSFKKNIAIYGFPVIRKELRATSHAKTFMGKNLRIALLALYDEFVGTHTIDIHEELTSITEKYYETYKKLGGMTSKHLLYTDYLIVACAAKNKLDIVVSNDDATMLSELSLKSYHLVNEILGLKNPKFINYIKLKRLLVR